MQVNDILRVKGSLVVTTEAETSIADVARLLTLEKVGAALVLEADGSVEGIISERDVVRGLAARGAAVLPMRVRDLMSRDVICCSPDDSVSEIMSIMTSRRIRHLPVVSNGQLAGIVSIGDVVKSRLEETETEATVLREYITAH